MDDTKNQLPSQKRVYQDNLLSHITERISHTPELSEILATTVVEIRRFLSIDRVKIYRFDPDGSGDVVAESINGDRLPSLLGLHFPASDIPPQARELLIKARQRIIVDVISGQKSLSYTHSEAIISRDQQKDIRYTPVDSCHRKYLQTMGVAASLSIPILYQNHLWGLMVAHHSQPKSFTEQELQIVQLLVDQLLIAIAQSNLFLQAQQQAQQETAINELKNWLSAGLDKEESRLSILKYIVTTLNGNGGRFYIRSDIAELPGQIYTWGEQPNCQVIEESTIWQTLMGWQDILAVRNRQSSEEIRTWNKNQNSDGSIHQPSAIYCYSITDFEQDTQLQPLVNTFANTLIKSLLIIPLQYQHQYLGCLTVFRPEIETETLWAGRFNHDKRNLRPRESFATWREIKTGQAQPWSQHEIKLAQSLGLHLYIGIMQQRVENLLHHHTSCDILTGLPNRSLFDKILALSLVNIHQRGGILAVLCLDIDSFQTINDSLGHAMGDRLLQIIANRIKTCLRQEDTLARWGDDEFTLLLSQINCADEATKFAQKLLDVIAQPLKIDNQELHITATVGIALAPYDGEAAETLLKHADTTLNHAKQQGKNSYLLYTAAMNATSLERLVLGNNLYKALGRQELLLHYQPQIDLKTGRIIGMEALLRWHHPEIGLVSPSQFIPLAEETGLICDIGEWVLRTACTQNRLWQLAGLPPLRIAVNLSARQFQQPNLVQTITQILQENQLEPEYLELEITESLLMEDVDFTVAVLRELQALGVHISIDDFGTGYSSLSLLMYFPLSSLKIDQSFIRNLNKNSSNAAIINSVISLGHGLNLTVIAEGVENVEELEFLRLANCDIIQGYLLSKPLTGEATNQFLQEQFSQDTKPSLEHSLASTVVNSVPINELQRLDALKQYQILDTPDDPSFNDLTRLLARLSDTPISFISFIDEKRQWFKSKHGLTINETPREISFCTYTICSNDVFVIADTLTDPRFATNPLVTSYPQLRFYAGVPLVTNDGFALGTLCIADYIPRELNQEQLETLKIFAVQVMNKLELQHQQIQIQHLQKHLHQFDEVKKLKEELATTISLYRHKELENKQAEKLLRLQTEQEKLIAKITQRILQSFNLEEIINTTVQEVRQFLQTDRVIIYRFQEDWSGVIAMESVADGVQPIIYTSIDEPCFRNVYIPQYLQGRVRAIDDIYTTKLDKCHRDLLTQFQVKANLVVPIIQNQELWGLLIAHDCSNPRHWQELEINLLSQLATQVGIAIKQSQLYQQLQHLATIDGLTQIPNRRRFEEYFQQTWDQMVQIQAPLSVILCDIDFFKLYNDNYGHLAGDDCLRQVADAINKAGYRPDDLVARYGGEEFVVLLPNTSTLGAMQVGERIRAEVKALKIVHEKSLVSQYVTLSLGIATIMPTANCVPATLIAAADEALYQAKAQGRDCLYY